AGAHLKKSVLELGGSDPFIVLPSANLDQAAAAAVQARTINNGQSCIAAKRFIVDRAVADEFERRFVGRMGARTVSEPLDEATELGPLATAEVLDALETQVNQSLAAGARVLLGGQRLRRSGFYFAPTVLTDVPPEAPARREELFGPVATLIRVDGIEEALRVA